MTSLGSALKTVLVTGGASGLGAAIVESVRRRGGTAVSLDVAESKRFPESIVADVCDRAALTGAVEALVARHGPLTGLVCCAGIDACGKLDEVPAEAWERVIHVNLLGIANAVRVCLPYLKRNRESRIVTVASTLGLRAVSDATAYCASKFGVIGFTRALAAETAGRLGVTLLIPGGMDTPFFDGRAERYRPVTTANLNRPELVAEAVAFALSQPAGCEVRELLVCASTETSWP